jgi:hypothetical protein
MKNAASRLSPGMTVSNPTRAAADVRRVAWSRTLPLAVWCRPAALLILRGQESPATVSAADRFRQSHPRPAKAQGD